MEESRKIAKIINYLEKGRYDKEFETEKKWIDHYKESLTKEGTKIGGFSFVRDTWCWIILKPTDIAIEPQFKGEPLVKVVPFIDHLVDDVESLVKILQEVAWCYI